MVSGVEQPVEQLLQHTFGNGSWVFTLRMMLLFRKNRISCQRSKKKRKKKDNIDLRDSGIGRSADPVTQAGPWGALSAHSFTPQVHGSSRHDCSVAAMSTCLSASITADDAAWGGKQDPGLRRVSRIAEAAGWCGLQTWARPSTLIVASAAHGHLINTPAPGALMTHRSKCVQEHINNGRE